MGRQDVNHISSDSQTIDCGHCGVHAVMKTVSQYGYYDGKEDDPVGGTGHSYYLLQCPKCHGVTLAHIEWSWIYDDWEEVYSKRPEGDATIHFPQGATIPSVLGLPESIRRFYEASRKVRHVSPDAYVMLVRKLLEASCRLLGAKDGNLWSMVEDLAKSGRFSADLATIAHMLRELGNHGAHPDLEMMEMPPESAPVVEKLCDAFLTSVYTTPKLTADAKEFLRQLEERKSKAKTIPTSS